MARGSENGRPLCNCEGGAKGALRTVPMTDVLNAFSTHWGGEVAGRTDAQRGLVHTRLMYETGTRHGTPALLC
eukprot:6494775-Heterocapsa_arctica.AAC.1